MPTWKFGTELQGFASDRDEAPHDLYRQCLEKVECGVEEERGKIIKCSECEFSPCIWEDNKDHMERLDSQLNPSGMPNNVRRKLMYRKMNGIIEGMPMREAQRKRLPTCVEDGIRKILPDPHGLYMGYLDY